MNTAEFTELADPIIPLPCCDIDRASESTWACFNAEQTHRYSLGRCWDHSKPMLVCLLLNPSYANKYILDRTLTRVQTFARDWGYGGFECVNAFSLVSTDPKALVAGDPCDHNRLRNEATDHHIRRAVTNAAIIMVGWSSHLSLRQLSFRVPELLRMIGNQPVFAWKINASGHPSHPLYLLRTLTPIPFHLATPTPSQPSAKPRAIKRHLPRNRPGSAKRNTVKSLRITKAILPPKRVRDAETSDALPRRNAK